MSRTYTRSPNGFPMDAQWTPNGRPNGRPMDAYEKWGFGDDGLEKGKCVECAYLFFKCIITKSPFFTGVHWASIGASIGRPLGVQYRCPQVLYHLGPCWEYMRMCTVPEASEQGEKFRAGLQSKWHGIIKCAGVPMSGIADRACDLCVGVCMQCVSECV